MSNMSYCRFQNTRLDLQDCIDAINGGEINDLLQDFIKEQQEEF